MEDVQGDVTVVVPKTSDDKVLIVRRSEHESFSGKWEFPGGEVEEESVRACALREFKEETGLDADFVRDGESYIGEGSTGYWRLHPVLVNVSAESVELSEEHDEFRWISPDQLSEFETIGHNKALKRLEIIT